MLAQFFVPDDRIRDRSRRDHVPYDEWARHGILTATPGAIVDYDAVRATLQAWAAEFDVQMVAFDPWNATDLVSRLTQQDGLHLRRDAAGFASLSAPTKSLEKAILRGSSGMMGIRCCGGMSSNVAVETDPAGQSEAVERWRPPNALMASWR